MIEVEQRVIDQDAGDCLLACIASILEIPLDRVPMIRTEEGKPSPWDRWKDWLRPANLTMINLTHHGPVPGYAIRSIPSYVYEARTHAVVTLNGAVVWDPSPKRRNYDDDCYREWTSHSLLTPLDPMQPIETERLV